MLLVGSLLSAGCFGIADLRTDAMKAQNRAGENATARADGTAEFDRLTETAGLPAFWKLVNSGDRLELVLSDDWSSSFVRSFTPLPENRGRLRLVVKPGPEPEFAATVLPAAGGEPDANAIRFGIKHKRAYYSDPAADEERSGEDAADVKVYLESLWLYLALPLQLALAPGARTGAYVLPEAGAPASKGGGTDQLRRLFVSPGGADPSPDRDQYILWSEPDTGRLAFVEFTYREVFDFYSGALYYDDYREVSGFRLPFTTKITDGIQQPDSVHTIEIESVRRLRAP